MPDATPTGLTDPTSHAQSLAIDVGTDSTTLPLDDSRHAVDLICLSCNVVTTVSITQSFYRLFFLVNHALRSSIETLDADVKALTSLVSDNHLYDLERRVEHLSRAVHAHHLIMQSTLNHVTGSNTYTPTSVPSTPTTPTPSPMTQLNEDGEPTLSTCASTANASGNSYLTAPTVADDILSNSPPLKRPRSLRAIEHEDIKVSFRHMLKLLSALRSAPLSRLSGTVAAALSLPKPRERDLTVRSDGLSCVRDAATKLKFTVTTHFKSEQNAIAKLLTSLSARKCISALVHFVNAVVKDRMLVNCLRYVSDSDLIHLFHAISPTCPNSQTHETINTCANNRLRIVQNRQQNDNSTPSPCQQTIISDDEFRRVAIAVAQILTTQRWNVLCKQVSILNSIIMPSQKNPLVGILHMHKAIQVELQDLVKYCESIDPAHFKQMRTLSSRLEFLRRIHRCHAAGEEAILFKELQAKIEARIDDNSGEAILLHEDHDDEEVLFDQFAEQQAKLEATAQQNREDTEALHSVKTKLIESVNEVSRHITSHMEKEESQLLPLVEQYFSIEDQDRMMRNVMAMVPAEFIDDVIPWMFNALDVDEREAMLRNLLQTTPNNQLRKVIGSIAKSVNKGLTQRVQWREICLRLPEVEEICYGLVDNDEEDEGPVSEIMRVHKVFRVELKAIVEKCKEIRADDSSPDPTKLVSLAQGVAFLWKMVTNHAQAEDDIILPRMEARIPGISEMYHNDHCDEQKLFQDLARCLQELQCVADENRCIGLIQKLHGLAQTLRDEMVSHLEKEEKHMWPVLKQNFSKKEQSEIVALIFGQMPASMLRQFLPWMIRILSVAEGNTMMNHIMQITKSTLFEKWLKTWLPLPGQENEQSNGSRVDNMNNVSSVNGTSSSAHHGNRRGVNIMSVASFQSPPTPSTNGSYAGQPSHVSSPPAANATSSTGSSSGDGATTALAFLHGRQTMEETIRGIARDSSLSVQERTRMMQQVMLAPYSSQLRGSLVGSSSGVGGQTNSNSVAGSDENATNVREDRRKTYVVGADRKKRLGCRHYLRGCKVRAACCGKLYTCRLCHDETEQTHIMDRYATKEIVCMWCGTAQPISRRCINQQCLKVFARYFCDVCKFYDDSPGRHIYHCPSCNVCRGGKGLGIDFFHCMTCNQCMSMKYRNKGHKCVHRAMESDCPVCHNFLFTSTTPIKYLRCGHLMHHECYVKFVQQRGVRCPVCSKSLEEMKVIFSKIDELVAVDGIYAMPSAYRGMKCHVYCLDCQQLSTRSYHFVFNRCNLCNSYNTRVEHIDVNPTTGVTDRGASSPQPSAP